MSNKMNVGQYLVTFSLLVSSIVPYSSGGLLSLILWVLPIYVGLKLKLCLRLKHYLLLILYCILVIILSSFFHGTPLYLSPF